MLRLTLLIVCLLSVAAPVAAVGWQHLGGVGVFTNDFLGDGHDRWQTASFARSEVYTRGTARLEFRLRAQIIAPRHISRPPETGERAFVGIIAPGVSLGVASDQSEVMAGVEAVITGPKTGIAGLMERVHDEFGLDPVVAASTQLGDKVIPTLRAEYAHRWTTPDRLIRPFAEAQIGAEGLARAGIDVVLGQDVSAMSFVREHVTGHLMAVSRPRVTQGARLSAGLDITHVFASRFLDRESAEPWRLRLRLGSDVRVLGQDIFYGLAALGPEYDGQYETQIVGSVAALFRF